MARCITGNASVLKVTRWSGVDNLLCFLYLLVCRYLFLSLHKMTAIFLYIALYLKCTTSIVPVALHPVLSLAVPCRQNEIGDSVYEMC